jgi:peptide/nickel transport system substrate-binding protein
LKKGYFTIILVLVFSVIFLLAGCGTPAATTTQAPPPATSPSATTPTPTAAGPQYGGTLVYVRNTGLSILGAPSDMPSFSWYNQIILPVLEPICILDTQGNPAPWLAKSIDVAPDGKTITFHLNSGIKFQDGTDFDAAAVKYNFESVIKANVAGSDVFSNVTSMDVVDPLTLRLTLTQYDARLLPGLASSTIGQIASPTALAKPATADTAAQLHLVGTGPFVFDSWQRDQFVRFTKWDGYWQKGKPYLDAIEFRNNPDVPTSLLSLKAGEVNWVENVDPSDYIAMTKEGYTGFIATDIFFIFSITPDSANPSSPCSDLKVRQALQYAIDRPGMAAGIGQGTMWPIYQQAVEKDPWFVKNQPQLNYDPAKAKQLLADAGYPNGFTITLISDVRARKDQVTAVQSYWQDVGVKTTLDVADVPRITGYGKDGWEGLLMPGFPNADTFTSWLGLYTSSIFTYPSLAWPSGFKDGMKAVIAEPDTSKRMALFSSLQKELWDGTLYIFYIGDSPRSLTDGTVMEANFYKDGIMGWWTPRDCWLKQK